MYHLKFWAFKNIYSQKNYDYLTKIHIHLKYFNKILTGKESCSKLSLPINYHLNDFKLKK